MPVDELPPPDYDGRSLRARWLDAAEYMRACGDDVEALLDQGVKNMKAWQVRSEESANDKQEGDDL